MEKTPNALRKHVVLLGPANAGKSTLFNALTEQDAAIVSSVPGTTTDPVQKAMELIPFGPIVLVDTAGLEDSSVLGGQRMKKTRMVLRRADAAYYVSEAGDFNRQTYAAFLEEGLDHILVLTKQEQASAALVEQLREEYPDAVFFSHKEDLDLLRARMATLLLMQQPEEESLLAGVIADGSHLILVVQVDSETPKGRMILPQIQVLRDALDHHMTVTVCRETELEQTVQRFPQVDLVVTDSQLFAGVHQKLPASIPLTSFSLLLARQKGNFAQLLEGADKIRTLQDGAHILMLEGCTHNRTHEDIGRNKIPTLLQKKTGRQLQFDYFSGYDFPSDLSGYALAIQCGSCMINRREIQMRLKKMQQAGLAVTNYGIVLAWVNGILKRSTEILI